MALLKYFLPFFFILFGLGELTRIQFPNSAAFNFTDIAVILLLVSFLFKNRGLGQFKLSKSILLFAGAALLSLVANSLTYNPNQILIASLYLVRWISYAGIYFIIKKESKEKKENITKYLLGSSVLILLIGFLQYFLYPSLKNLYYLGWDEHMFRMFSSFMDPNFAGIMFCLIAILTFCLSEVRKGRERIILLMLSGISLLSVVLSYSRGAIVMIIFSAVIYSALKRNYKLLLFIILAFSLSFILLSRNFYIENTNLLRKASSTQRIQSSIEALKIYQKNPVFGVGFNTLRYAREKYGIKDMSKFGPSHSGAGADNSFVLVLATAGAPGLFAYIFLLYSILKLGLRNYKKNVFGLILIVSLSGLMVNALFINSLFYSFAMLWIWVLAGLTESS